MTPQGSALLNLDYFTNLTASINEVQSCAELQVLVTEAFNSVSGFKAGITAELASLNPILSLLTPPTSSPGSIITWITSFITDFMTPMVKPTITYAAQLTALTAEIAALTSAITSAQAKFPSCSITIPPI